MSAEYQFKTFKYTCWAFEKTISECNAENAENRPDCECCNTRGQVCCAGMLWAITPCTFLVDLFACGPRYIHHKCHTKPKPVVTIQPIA